MKVFELIIEASKAEIARQKAAKVKAEFERKKAEQEEVARKEAEIAQRLERKKQRKLSKFSQPIYAEPEKKAEKKPAAATGFLDNPELAKYMVDPSIDTEYQGGYYLQFHDTPDTVIAYWSHDLDASFDSIISNFGNQQIQNLGSQFDPGKFDQLINKLLVKSRDKKTGQLGYVQVIITKSQYLNVTHGHTVFFSEMMQHLAREYPGDEYSGHSYVGWELS
jgi:hypothetical protein